MPVPTDQLAEQLAELKRELGSFRKDALDQFQKISDTFDSHLWRIDEKVTSDLTDLRREVVSGKEALTMELTSLREDLARFQTRTDTLIAVTNRIFATLLAVFLALIGTVIATFWGASRVYHTVEFHNQRIEKVEKSLDYLPKLQQSIDRLQQTIESQKKAPSS